MQAAIQSAVITSVVRGTCRIITYWGWDSSHKAQKDRDSHWGFSWEDSWTGCV